MLTRNLAVAAILSTVYSTSAYALDAEDDLSALNLEELLNIEITSVSGKAESLSDAPAAAYVITNEAIKNSGVTNIPDALRLAPGVVVARVDSNKWAVSSRGFNGRFANKLLVMVDGRSMYTSTFSGVYWEHMDTLLEDIERIEVIRGPGATLWGANAVNGVINIITKHSADTEGWYAQASAGDYEQGAASLRYGSSVGQKTFVRGYGKFFQRDAYNSPQNEDNGDDWEGASAGLRLDSQVTNSDTLLVTADASHTHMGQTTSSPSITPPYVLVEKDRIEVETANLNVMWNRILSPSSELKIQTYLDHTARDGSIVDDTQTTLDLSLQHNYSGLENQEITWGMGFRNTEKKLGETSYVLDSIETSSNLSSAFIQDKLTLKEDKLWLTIGSKFEDHETTGIEVQPSVRLQWSPKNHHKLWSSVSRAVRTPSLAEQYIQVLSQVTPPLSTANPSPLPIHLIIEGSAEFEPETTTSYELGYRWLVADNLSMDIALYHSEYKDIRGYEYHDLVIEPTQMVQTVTFVNSGAATTQGLELSAQWRPNDWSDWEMSYAYSELDSQSNLDYLLGPNPKHQVSVRSAFTLNNKTNLNIWLRYLDEIEALDARTAGRGLIDAYTTLDAKLAYKPKENLEVSLTGQNLLDSSHLEYIPEQFTSSAVVPRSVFAGISYNF